MSTDAVVPPDPGSPEPEQDVVRMLALLAETAPKIVAELDALSEDSGNQFVSLATRAERDGRQIRRTKRLTWALAASVLLDILLSVSMILVVIQVRHNENSNAANQAATSALAHRIDIAQTVTRQKTLCPLYTLLLTSDTPAARAAAKDKAVYDHTVMVIRDGYDALGCAAFVTDPPKSG